MKINDRKGYLESGWSKKFREHYLYPNRIWNDWWNNYEVYIDSFQREKELMCICTSLLRPKTQTELLEFLKKLNKENLLPKFKSYLLHDKHLSKLLSYLTKEAGVPTWLWTVEGLKSTISNKQIKIGYKVQMLTDTSAEKIDEKDLYSVEKGGDIDGRVKTFFVDHHHYPMELGGEFGVTHLKEVIRNLFIKYGTYINESEIIEDMFEEYNHPQRKLFMWSPVMYSDYFVRLVLLLVLIYKRLREGKNLSDLPIFHEKHEFKISDFDDFKDFYLFRRWAKSLKRLSQKEANNWLEEASYDTRMYDWIDKSIERYKSLQQIKNLKRKRDLLVI